MIIDYSPLISSFPNRSLAGGDETARGGPRAAEGGDRSHRRAGEGGAGEAGGPAARARAVRHQDEGEPTED